MGLAFGSPIILHTEPEQQDQPFGLDTRASSYKQVRRFPREDSMIYLRFVAIRGLPGLIDFVLILGHN